MKQHQHTCGLRVWDQDGFSLIEVLVVLAISSVVILAVYNLYIDQINSANAQEKILAMRQNLRVGHFVIGRELMKAGYSSQLTDEETPGFTQAEKSALAFTYVDDSSEDEVTVSFYFEDNTIYRKIDDADASIIAEGIEYLEFMYHLKDASASWAPSATNLDEIIGVTVSILGRTGNALSDYPNTYTFEFPNPDGETENTLTYSSDGFYRQLCTGFLNAEIWLQIRGDT